MASEPNNNADELLKRYAEERRKQAVPASELHSASRRILQGEVARVYGGQQRSALPWWRRILGSPQIGWACALAAVVGISFYANRQPSPIPQEAKPVAPAVKTDALAPAPKMEEPIKAKENLPAPAVATDETAVKDQFKKEALQNRRAQPPVEPPRSLAAPAPAISPATAAPGSAPVTSEVRLRQELDVRKSIADKDVQRAAAESLTFSNSAGPESNNRRFDGGGGGFGNSLANNSDVLNRFTLTQVGSNLRLQEPDGSAYTGLVTAAVANSQTNFFRAQGMNRRLQQSVVITGQILRASAPAQSGLGGRLQQQTAQQVPLAGEQMRVQGQATVGTSNQIQIDAQRTAPVR